MNADQTFLDFGAAKAAAELNLLASVACDPARAVPVAEAAGAHQHLFGEEDLRLIYLACDLARRYGVPGVIRLARRALRDAGYWSDRGPRRLGRLPWSDASLALLAESYFFAPSVIRQYARRLVELDARRLELDSALRRLAEPSKVVAPRRQRPYPPPGSSSSPTRRSRSRHTPPAEGSVRHEH